MARLGRRARRRVRSQYLGRAGARAGAGVVRSLAARARWYVMAASLLGGALGAQAPDSTQGPLVAVGTRLRVWQLAAHDLSIPVVGRLARVTADSVDIRPDGDHLALAVSRPLITRVESSVGPHSGSRSRTALMGAAIGALGGGILGIIAGNLSRSNAARLGIYSGLAGAGIGAAAGAAAPGDTWQRATLPRD